MTRLTVAEYNAARIEAALIARLREKGLPVKWEPGLYTVAASATTSAPCRACGSTEPVWPPPARADGAPRHPEKPSKPRGDWAEQGRPGMLARSAKLAFLTAPGHPTRRAALHGGLERIRGGAGWWGECWAPAIFGALGRVPGVQVVRETRAVLRVRVPPDALRPVVELFGFRTPARTVARLLEADAHRRARSAA